MKIFLSHSSNDKDIVEKVYNELGAGICHYDVATFDPTGFLPDQIYSALAESTHFVLFASEKALNSDWVKGELKNLFINWMRSKTTHVMVFLLRGGDFSLIPDWLKTYVITEHPTPTHIACRILSEYDQWQNDKSNIPPFRRFDDLKYLETNLMVEAAKMPSCLLIGGWDGFGRKELINEVFSRNFRNISHRKIHIHTEKFDSDVDFYKSLKGIFSLTTAREFVNAVNSYKDLPLNQRLDQIIELIQELCKSSQTIILDAADSIFDDTGEINNWLEQLINKFPSTPYPYLNITTNRRPGYIKASILEKTVVRYLEPLSTQDSLYLFQWWLNKLEIYLSNPVKELVLEQVVGNPKQIEFAARLLKNVPDSSDIGNIKRYVFSDLDRNASKLIVNITSGDLSKLILSLVADCGTIAISDLLIVIEQVTNKDAESIRKSYQDLRLYGLIQSDDICVKVPKFLIRTAKSLSRTEPVTTQLKNCWNMIAESMGKISCDDETSFTILNEACILKLRAGVNSIDALGIESLILPSQCLRTARQLYDNNEYSHAYELSNRAFIARLALTDDGAIEALRYCGMSAARLNNEEKLQETIKKFKEYSSNRRAQRIHDFIQGFNFRLAGDFDKALSHMQKAVDLKGDHDIHILRELAFLYLSTNDLQKAKIYIHKAAAKARNNSFILEIQILIELAQGKGYVIHNEKSISEMIDDLEYIDPFNNKSHAFRVKIEYLITKSDIKEARRLFDSYYTKNGDNIPKNLLEAKLLIAEKKFSDAVSLLTAAKDMVLKKQDPQRKSTMPMIADLLIQAASGVSISNGIIEYKQNKKHLPIAIQEKTRKELIEQIAYSKHQVSSEEKSTLNL